MTTSWDKEESRKSEELKRMRDANKPKVLMSRNRLLFTYGVWGVIGFLFGFVIFSP